MLARASGGNLIMGGSKAGRRSICELFPDVFQYVEEVLRGLRGAGLSVNAPVVRNVILGVIRKMQQDILDRVLDKGTGRTIVISNSFAKRFLSEKLKWSYHASTKSSQKLPI